MRIKKFAFSLTPLFITFAVGVAVTSLWLLRSASDDGEKPPCRDCAQVYSSAVSELPTVSLCDVASAPWEYDGRVIRVRATLRHDAGYFGLSDGQCSRGAFIQLVFDPSAQACKGAREELDKQLGHNHRCLSHPFGFDGTSNATLVGRFEQEQGLRFVLLCIEQVEPMPNDPWH